MLLSEHADSLELAATLETHVPGLGQAGRGAPPSGHGTGGRQPWRHRVPAPMGAAPASDGGCGKAVGSCSPPPGTDGGPPATITPSLPAPSHPGGIQEPREGAGAVGTWRGDCSPRMGSGPPAAARTILVGLVPAAWVRGDVFGFPGLLLAPTGLGSLRLSIPERGRGLFGGDTQGGRPLLSPSCPASTLGCWQQHPALASPCGGGSWGWGGAGTGCPSTHTAAPAATPRLRPTCALLLHPAPRAPSSCPQPRAPPRELQHPQNCISHPNPRGRSGAGAVFVAFPRRRGTADRAARPLGCPQPD